MKNTERDYYSILQVDPKAEEEVIRAAYNRLAAKYHPDVNHQQGASDKMKLLNAAYEVLGDPYKRMEYDQRRARVMAMQRAPERVIYKYRIWWFVPLGSILIITLLRFRPKFILWGIILLAVVWLLVRQKH